MKKIVVVFGTRPEAIKLIKVIEQLQLHCHVKVCVTAQHREMLDSVLKIFNLNPDYDLNIMKPNQDLLSITNSVMKGLSKVLLKEKPDMVIVHGDTTTAMASAIAAFYLRIPVAHVEAGLRTRDLYSPFPEELNRQVVARASTFHFAPTGNARQNLINENIDEKQILVTGNTSIDTLISSVMPARNINYSKELLSIIDDKNLHEKVILVTGHRRENFGEKFKNVCKALLDIANLHPEVKIIYPVHFNPNVRNLVKSILSNVSNIYLIDPLDYLTFVKLMDASYLIITDSGGVQEEAPSLGKPVLVTRDITERPEGVDAGTVIIVGTDRKKIIHEVTNLIVNKEHYIEMSKINNPYGDGNASKRISSFIQEVLH
jgi:UDP-N-acetylglucosamine 2-epimerase (non-hydrolysing)